MDIVMQKIHCARRLILSKQGYVAVLTFLVNMTCNFTFKTVGQGLSVYNM